MLKLYRFTLAVTITAALFTSCKKKAEIIPEVPPVPKDATKTLTAFSFPAGKNPTLKMTGDAVMIGDTVFISTVAGTDLSALTPTFTFKGSKITVNDTAQVSNVTARSFYKPVVYTVTAEDNSTKNYVVKFTDSGLPVVYINTNNIAINSKDNYVAGSLKIIGDVAGTVLYNGTTQIKGRGNSTWTMAKKPYKIKLDKKASILGMSESKNWVLLANYADKSLIRNELAFELSRHSGLVYTTSSRFVDVILNGDYVGNYQLTEQINQGKNQVNVEDQAKGANTLPDISGGYMVEIDGFADGEPVHFYTNNNMPVTVKYPDDGDINQQQKDYIQQHFQKFEDALFAGNFTDPVNGYRKYFDVDSYVNYYIVSEVMGNSDTFWSTYMYKKKNDDKIYTGPVWDFDIAANNDDRLGDAVNLLMYTNAHDPKQWINRLMQDPGFRQKIRNRWNELKPYITTFPGITDQLAKKLAVSQKRNFERWDILSVKVYLEYHIAGTYPGEVKYVKDYLTNRINWLDGKFNSNDYQ
ncbi:CotH protein [Mucilaginibacter pineti]|uniref:CotH protein n=1 Tax=Mucilaginibacter pineti TaxID=1391627 RepID=A0A1G7E1E3_9SPHI|nr:CotH kinase family protein [Mucilaginibacter pineti]SDE57523.1 CotH protein [Mucilaginibacter pineti]